ncbi:MAG: hypothetical protein Kow0029_19110 [Candidatus Rifleibacteriota bacterium]
MFLKDLNPHQQKLFLGLARELIEADDRISAQEAEMIANLSAEMGQQELIRNPSDEVLQQFFPDKNSRVAVMLELIALAGCDNSITKEEGKILARLKKIFGISDEEMEAYTGWVRKLFATYAEAAKFFEVGK